MYLALDTSTESAGLALAQDCRLLAVDTWRCVQNHSVELLPHIVKLLDSIKAGIQDISGVIVARGPGSYNGLRVGLGTAKGLAFGLGVPIAGVSTLSAEAYRYAATGLPVCALLPAGRSDVAWAVFREAGGDWQNIMPETVSELAGIFPHIATATIFAGEVASSVYESICAALGELAVLPIKPLKSRAQALLELGAQRLDAAHADDVASLQPLYLRRPSITRPRSKAAGLRQSLPAVIWDMDGVLVDSAELHLAAWQQTFSQRGVDFSRDDFHRTFGMVNKDIIAFKLGDVAADLTKAIGHEKEEAFRNLVRQSHIQPLPGAAPLIESLFSQGVPMALATSAPRANAELILGLVGFSRFFQAVVSEEDVTRGKPDPQPFLLAAERLDIPPDKAAVIEDAPAGLAAARAGGMKSIGVATSHNRTQLAAADLVVDSLTNLSAQMIFNIFKEK